MSKKPSISVVLSTYNAEAWLEKVLYGFQYQDFKDFELVIADDGSRKETKDLIDLMTSVVSYPIVHVWQEDQGFQKSRILNKAIVASQGDYIVMTDGDCIPRKDFLSVHAAHMEPGYFLSGGYFMLPMDISKAITKQDIQQGNCFDLLWLKSLGLKNSFKNNKLSAKGFLAYFLNKATPTNASWNGHNASGFKADVLKVNGFDERMQYGGQDRELGVVLGMGFQAWLGATVVYSVLAPVKITTHMLMALAIVAALILIIQKANPRIERTKYMANFHKAISYLLFIFLLEIVFGTQVREFVDHQLDLGITKDNWLLNPSIIFYVHRSFSILPLGIAVYLFWINKRNELGFASTKPLLAGMIIAAFSGMAMYYIDFPLGTQPIHLVIAAILFGQIFYIFLQSRKAKNNISKTK